MNFRYRGSISSIAIPEVVSLSSFRFQVSHNDGHPSYRLQKLQTRSVARIQRDTGVGMGVPSILGAESPGSKNLKHTDDLTLTIGPHLPRIGFFVLVSSLYVYFVITSPPAFRCTLNSLSYSKISSVFSAYRNFTHQTREFTFIYFWLRPCQLPTATAEQ